MLPQYLLSLILSAGLTTASSVTAGTKNKALGKSINLDFSSESDYFETYHYGDNVKYGTDDGLELTLAKRFDNPSIKSKFYIQFGRTEAIVKAAPGTGIATTFYLQSDDKDEIDVEWLGGDDTQVQSNFFSKGDTTTYDRGGLHPVNSPTTSFHNYTIDWTQDSTKWYVDGNLVRTLNSDSPSGYPQAPMAVYIGLWAAGDSSNAEGTIEWAGGLTDYSQAPFNAYFKQLVVTDYSTGDNYEYSDSTGSWESIKSDTGKILGNLNGSAVEKDSSSSSSSSSASSSTSAASSSSASSSVASSSSASSSVASASSSSTSAASSSSASSSVASSSVSATSVASSSSIGSSSSVTSTLAPSSSVKATSSSVKISSTEASTEAASSTDSEINSEAETDSSSATASTLASSVTSDGSGVTAIISSSDASSTVASVELSTNGAAHSQNNRGIVALFYTFFFAVSSVFLL